MQQLLKSQYQGVPAELAAKVLGKTYDEATGLVLDTGEPTPPDCAVSFRFNRGTDGYRYYQYLKGTFTGGAEEAHTKEQEYDIRTYQLTFTAVTTNHLFDVGGKAKPVKRIYGDTADANFTGAETWFDAVQKPAEVAPEA